MFLRRRSKFFLDIAGASSSSSSSSWSAASTVQRLASMVTLAPARHSFRLVLCGSPTDGEGSTYPIFHPREPQVLVLGTLQVLVLGTLGFAGRGAATSRLVHSPSLLLLHCDNWPNVILLNNDLQTTLWVTQRCFVRFKRAADQRLRQWKSVLESEQ